MIFVFVRLCVVVTVLTIAASCARAEEKPRRYAILVGVNEYQHEKLPALQYAVNDVTELAAELRKAGYETAVLSDPLGKLDEKLRPTKANIQSMLHAVLQKCQRRDIVVVAFAGHGVQFEGEKECFFCPADARPLKNQIDSLMSLSRVYDEMDASFAGMKVLLVDACRDDPTTSRGIHADAALRPPHGVAALFSCRAGERAFETPKLKHGIFFYHVIEGLKGKAADTERAVTFAGLSAYVSRRVARDVPQLMGGGASQSPNLKADYSLEPVLVHFDPAAATKPQQSADKTHSPEALCRRLAEDLNAEVRRKKLRKIGVLEFLRPHGPNMQLAAESLPRYCAEQIVGALKELSAGDYVVLGPQDMAVAMKGIIAEKSREPESLRQIAQKAGSADAIVFGLLRAGANLTLRSELVATSDGAILGSGSGAVPLNEDLIADTGLAIDNRQRPAGPPTSEAVIRHAQGAAGEGLPLDFPFKVEIHTVQARPGEEITKATPRQLKMRRSRDTETSTGKARKEYLIGVTENEIVEIHVRNDAKIPVAMQLMVDGLNSLGQTRDRLGLGKMWVLQPGIDYVIAGWNLPDDVLKRFRFVDAAQSVAGRQGFGESIGLITAAFYYEYGRALGVGEGPEEKRPLVMKDFRAGRLAGAVQLRYVDERALGD